MIDNALGCIADNEQNYKPCDPKLVHDRIAELKSSFDELNKLARYRKNKLEESKKLWQFTT